MANLTKKSNRGLQGIDLRAALAKKSIESHAALELTFKEVAEAYLATRYSGCSNQIKKWIALFDDRNAWSIEPSELDEAGAAMIEHGYSPATVNRNMSQLGSVYRWAIRTRRIAPKGFISPTLNLTRYPEECKPVALSEIEAQRLIAGAVAFRDRRFGVYIRLLIESGARRSEVLERTWEEIDLAKCEIYVGKTKTGTKRVLHFSPETAAMMKRIWPTRDGMLFGSVRTPGKPTEYKKSWKMLAQSIGRPELRLHDLRHYRAKQMIASGVPIAVAAQALGHSSLILHRRYGHLETEATANAIRKSWEAA